MKKSTLIMMVSIVLAIALGVGGTLAYLVDQDADVNTMTLGSVKIVQNEQQRDEEGNLVPFENDKPAFPAVGPIEWADEGVEINGVEYKVFVDDLQNVVDKMVTVTNIGNSDAYIRTIIALEAPGYDAKDLIHVNVNVDGVSNGPWTPVDINGVQYVYSVFTYPEALAAKETSVPSLMQLFLDKETTNEDVAAYGDKWEVLVLSQAVQAAGFADAETALNEAFGEAIPAKVADWLGNITEDDIGSPSDDGVNDKNDTNNPPLILPETNWAAYADTSWYNDTDKEFTISTAEELAGLAELVNAGNDFKDKAITLAAPIDLGEHLWTPIGTSSAIFKGNFDGDENTISNLKINTPTESNVGLFGHTRDGIIENVVVDNAYVNGYLNVAVVAGNPYSSEYKNITVTGLVKVEGFAYVGAVGGKNVYEDWTGITVDVDAGSYVKANSIEGETAYRTYVGGVIGFMGEGGHTVSNVTSNIDVIGSTCDVGGITGIAHYDNSFVNCSSSGDVTITDATEAGEAEEIGGIAGVWHNGNGHTVTFDGCSYTGNLSVNVADVDLSDNTITGAAYSATGTGVLIIK